MRLAAPTRVFSQRHQRLKLLLRSTPTESWALSNGYSWKAIFDVQQCRMATFALYQIISVHQHLFLVPARKYKGVRRKQVNMKTFQQEISFPLRFNRSVELIRSSLPIPHLKSISFPGVPLSSSALAGVATVFFGLRLPAAFSRPTARSHESRQATLMAVCPTPFYLRPL